VVMEMDINKLVQKEIAEKDGPILWVTEPEFSRSVLLELQEQYGVLSMSLFGDDSSESIDLKKCRAIPEGELIKWKHFYEIFLMAGGLPEELAAGFAVQPTGTEEELELLIDFFNGRIEEESWCKADEGEDDYFEETSREKSLLIHFRM